MPAIAHLQTRPAWATQSIVDLAYAKLGSSLTPAADLGPRGFAFLGVPFEGLLINEIGGKGGPEGLRQALSRLRPYSVDLDLDFIETNGLADFGDVEVDLMDYGVSLANTESVYGELLKRGLTPVVAGGSHTISEATIRAFSEHHGKNIGVVWFDAHPDLMNDYKGDRHYCGCPMRRLIESGHLDPKRVVFFGLRGFANAGAEIRLGREMGVAFYTMEEIDDKGVDACVKEALERVQGTNAFYITFDTDVLDHAVGAATQYPAPGGLQAFQAMKFVRKLAMAGAAAFDIVEYAPLIDQSRATGSTLATLMCEFMAGRAWFERQAGRAGKHKSGAEPVGA